MRLKGIEMEALNVRRRCNSDQGGSSPVGIMGLKTVLEDMADIEPVLIAKRLADTV